MERSRLRAATGMRYALLNPILDELAKEGRIKITAGRHEDLVSLRIDKAKVGDYIAGNDGQVTDRMTRNSSLAV